MKEFKTEDVNIANLQPLVSPVQLKTELASSKKAISTVFKSREVIKHILQGDDPRLLVVVGPCSIHNTESGLKYAQNLVKLKKELEDKMFFIMRSYFEKPRTTIGWKGLINDPNLDGSCDVTKGLRIGRKFLLTIAEMNIPTASEMLDPISPQYISDLISYASIGARTTESQVHREMVSGLSMPMGFKNGTDGNTNVAIAGMESALHPHSFIGINQKGESCIVRTKGNTWGHLILRGGKDGPNYDETHITKAVEALKQKNLNQRLLVDCSHANSGKRPEHQKDVLKNVVKQINQGQSHIMGVMIESNLKFGNQPIPKDLSKLEYGVSITDSCLDWENTEILLKQAYEQLN